MKASKRILHSLDRRLSDIPALTPKQLWLLRSALIGFSPLSLSTIDCPGAVGATDLRGMQKRKLIEEQSHSIYRITQEGRRVLYAFAYVYNDHTQVEPIPSPEDKEC